MCAQMPETPSHRLEIQIYTYCFSLSPGPAVFLCHSLLPHALPCPSELECNGRGSYETPRFQSAGGLLFMRPPFSFLRYTCLPASLSFLRYCTCLPACLPVPREAATLGRFDRAFSAAAAATAAASRRRNSSCGNACRNESEKQSGGGRRAFLTCMWTNPVTRHTGPAVAGIAPKIEFFLLRSLWAEGQGTRIL